MNSDESDVDIEADDPETFEDFQPQLSYQPFPALSDLDDIDDGDGDGDDDDDDDYDNDNDKDDKNKLKSLDDIVTPTPDDIYVSIDSIPTSTTTTTPSSPISAVTAPSTAATIEDQECGTNETDSNPSVASPKNDIKRFKRTDLVSILDPDVGNAQSEDVLVNGEKDPASTQATNTDEEEYFSPIIINLSKINPLEMEYNSEWFRGNIKKTPERYMKIRNYILEKWNESKPQFLTKTSVRPGLKGSGDVNSIGRVHYYLEKIGAINVDCINKPTRIRKNIKRNSDVTQSVDLAPDERGILLGRRKRRVLDENGEYVDEKMLEGRTFSHVENSEIHIEPRKVKGKSSRQRREKISDNDSFRLIECRAYSSVNLPPFSVAIMSNVLIITDLHAHLDHAEVIGLLGGRFDKPTNKIEISVARPCHSLSTDHECEMDPLSEMEARGEFEKLGLSIVGWYHSHPTFHTSPSIRDIETQLNYQRLFTQDNGVEAFVGMIVSPYDVFARSNISSNSFFVVSHEKDPKYGNQIPYVCNTVIQPSPNPSVGLFESILSIVDMTSQRINCVDLHENYRRDNYSRLDKIIESLSPKLYTDDETKTNFLLKVRKILENSAQYQFFHEISTNPADVGI